MCQKELDTMNTAVAKTLSDAPLCHTVILCHYSSISFLKLITTNNHSNKMLLPLADQSELHILLISEIHCFQCISRCCI